MRLSHESPSSSHQAKSLLQQRLGPQTASTHKKPVPNLLQGGSLQQCQEKAQNHLPTNLLTVKQLRPVKEQELGACEAHKYTSVQDNGTQIVFPTTVMSERSHAIEKAEGNLLN